MKAAALLLLMASTVLLRADEAVEAPASIRLEIRSSDLDPAWFADLSPNNQELALKDGKVELPGVEMVLGSAGTIEVIHEKLLMVGGRAMPATCGITVEVTPTLEEDRIVLLGTVTLRRTGKADDVGPPPGYVYEKTYFRTAMPAGESRKVVVAGSGDQTQHLELHASRVDPAGEPQE